ncbi:MAG: MraY family glycosyltransferase [Acidobacteriota bacterium]
MRLTLIVIFSFLVTLFIQRIILNYFSKNRIGKRKDIERNSKGFRPRLGGVGIFLGFLISLVLILSMSSLNMFDYAKFPDVFQFNFYLISLFIIFMIGLIDDLIGLNAWQKLPVEIVAATILFFNGFAIKLLSIPFAPGKIVLPLLLSYIVTVLWIVGITNALNLIDGIDGLAGGIALLSSISFVIISYLNGKPHFALLAASMIGPLLAFLIYNFYPSKIYMGDSGSLVLGFYLATLSLKASSKASFGITFIVPIFILFLPILDTSLSFFRRIFKRKNPLRADDEHIHHKLMKMGNDERKVFYILMGWTFIFSVIGVLSTLLSKPFRLFFIAVIVIFAKVLMFNLNYLKIGPFKRIINKKK